MASMVGLDASAASVGRGGLRWQAPAGCPREAEVRTRLSEALGERADELDVVAEVSRREHERFEATVVLRGEWGESTRKLDSPTCDTLANAIVLLAKVSVTDAAPTAPILAVPEPEAEPSAGEPEVGSPEASDSAGGPSGELVSVASDATEPASQDPKASEAAVEDSSSESDAGAVRDSGRAPSSDAAPPSSQSSSRALLRVEARAGAGLLPQENLGGAATAGLERRWFRVELGGAGWLPRERTVAPDARVRVALWAVEAHACAAIRPRAWLTALPCAGLDVGRMSGQGTGAGLVVGRTSRQTWVAANVTAAASFRLARFVGLWVGASVVVPLRQLGFSVTGLERDAYRASPVAGRGALGLELLLP